MQKIHLKKEPILDVKKHAFIYQSEAVNAIKDLEYSAIFHEQGLGKTKIAIDLMLYWLKEKKVDTVLFLTKKSLLENWKEELSNHTFMKPSILSQNSARNYYVFNSPTRLILAHFEVILSEFYRLKDYFLRSRNVAIIIDEAAKIKNPETEISKALFGLSNLFTRRVIMTGTPVANRPQDIWSQIFFLDQGKALGRDFNEFKNQCDLNNSLIGDHQKQNEFENFTSTIFEKIKNFSVRQTKNSGVISLPKKIYYNEYCEFETIQEEMYNGIKDEMRIYITKNGIPQEDNDSEVLKRIIRLIQVCSNPKLVDENYNCESGKERKLKELVEIIIDRNEKLIIWTTYINNVEYLAKKLKFYGVMKIHGLMTYENRNYSVKMFKNDPEIKILIATPASAKEGLTLTIANNAIFYDRGLSLDDYIQSQDRIHRISQEKDCNIYNLIIGNSIDDWVDELLKSKQLAAQLAQGDITRETFNAQMTYSFGSIIKEIMGTKE